MVANNWIRVGRTCWHVPTAQRMVIAAVTHNRTQVYLRSAGIKPVVKIQTNPSEIRSRAPKVKVPTKPLGAFGYPSSPVNDAWSIWAGWESRKPAIRESVSHYLREKINHWDFKEGLLPYADYLEDQGDLRAIGYREIHRVLSDIYDKANAAILETWKSRSMGRVREIGSRAQLFDAIAREIGGDTPTQLDSEVFPGPFTEDEEGKRV